MSYGGSNPPLPKLFYDQNTRQFNKASMQSVQACQLLDKEEQEESWKKAWSKKALRMVPETYSAQGSKEIISRGVLDIMSWNTNIKNVHGF